MRIDIQRKTLVCADSQRIFWKSHNPDFAVQIDVAEVGDGVGINPTLCRLARLKIEGSCPCAAAVATGSQRATHDAINSIDRQANQTQRDNGYQPNQRDGDCIFYQPLPPRASPAGKFL